MLDPVTIGENLAGAKENFIKNYLIMNFAVGTIPLNEILFELEKDLIKYALLISEENQKKAVSKKNSPTTSKTSIYREFLFHRKKPSKRRM